jgi:UDPglucose 6-dehydrogenase
MPMLEASLRVNGARPTDVTRMLDTALGGLDGAEVTILGVAFKPDTDDVRESPAFPIAAALSRAGARVRLHDPVVQALPPGILDGTLVGHDLPLAIAGADAIVIVTPWHHYRDLPALVAALPAAPVVLDSRRAFAPTDFDRYVGVGRASDVPAAEGVPSAADQ